MLLPRLLFCCIAALVAAEHEDYDSEWSRPESWVDPNDPTAGMMRRTAAATADSPGTGVGQVVRGGGCSECLLQDPSLRLIIRNILSRLNVRSDEASVSRTAKVEITEYNMARIRSYLDLTEGADKELTNREIVRSAMEDLLYAIDDGPSWFSSMESFLNSLDSVLNAINLIILPPAFFILVRWCLSSRSAWSLFFFTVFVSSMFAAYERLYQEKLSQRMAETMTRELSHDPCAPPSIFQQGVGALRGLIYFQEVKSDCQKFVEAQTVPIHSQITLIDVFVDALFNGLFRPLEFAGKYLNRFCREFYSGIPLPAQLIMTALLILSIVRIRTPLLTIEPVLLSTAVEAVGAAGRWLSLAMSDQPNEPPRLDNATAQPMLAAADPRRAVQAAETTKRNQRPSSRQEHRPASRSSQQQALPAPRPAKRTIQAVLPDASDSSDNESSTSSPPSRAHTPTRVVLNDSQVTHRTPERIRRMQEREQSAAASSSSFEGGASANRMSQEF